MSVDAKKGYGSTLALIVLGLIALYCGSQWLMVLIPAAFLVWYAGARFRFRRSRS